MLRDGGKKGKKEKKRSNAINCEAGSLFFICIAFQILLGRISMGALKVQEISEELPVHRNLQWPQPLLLQFLISEHLLQSKGQQSR